MTALLLLLASLQVSPTPNAAELRRFVGTVVTQPKFAHAVWGIDIEDEQEVLVDRGAETLLVPASNRKLFAAAFIEDCLGTEKSLSTRVFVRGKIEGSRLHGDLVIRGDGDPSFAGRYDYDRDARLRPLLEALRQRGIDRIDGNIVADVALFGDDIIPPGWKSGYLDDYYAAPVDALAFNENVTGVDVGIDGCRFNSITLDPELQRPLLSKKCGQIERLEVKSDWSNRIHVSGELKSEGKAQHQVILAAMRDPARFTAQAIRDFLRRNGISSRGATVERTRTGDGEELMRFDSAPMATLLATVLKDSQNLYTEMLHKRAAAGELGQGTRLDQSLAMERSFLAGNVGIRSDSYAFEDASGLSAGNLVTPRALVKISRYLLAEPRRGVFAQLLDRPAEEGTLRKRLPELRDRVLAKTGTINGVVTLSGAVLRKDQPPIFFSMMINHFQGTSTEARDAMDQIVRKIAELYP